MNKQEKQTFLAAIFLAIICTVIMGVVVSYSKPLTDGLPAPIKTFPVEEYNTDLGSCALSVLQHDGHVNNAEREVCEMIARGSYE